jgi:alkylated DNA nucleotide flippase Atl1
MTLRERDSVVPRVEAHRDGEEPLSAAERSAKFSAAVLDLVDQIPAGRVMTYGSIAAYLGYGGPRGVGGVMAKDGLAVRWWRVVRADGMLAPHLMIDAQRQWNREATPLRRGIIDVRRAQWLPPPAVHKGRRRLTIRRSPIHGRGVFALVDIEAGERLLQFRGAVIRWDHVVGGDQSLGAGGRGSTYLLAMANDTVMDCANGGNSTRYLNHSCEPNCQAVEIGGGIYLYALTRVRAGAELLIDYALAVDDPDHPDTKASYLCHCSARKCRTTMLAAR